MSELQWVHLLDAHSAELLVECHAAGLYLALCGEQLTAEDLPALDCEPGSELEDAYCLACIGVATTRNYEVGAEAGCPPGVIVRADR
ncbi:MAG: hypothetical protein ACRDS1_01180 [Pseudonocardiaceae bacterium]